MQDPYRFHTPCAVNDTLGSRQLESRVAAGFHPSMILKGDISIPTKRAIFSALKENPTMYFSVDMGGCRSTDRAAAYLPVMQFVWEMRSVFPEQVNTVVQSKFGNAVSTHPGRSPQERLCSAVDAQRYLEAVDAQVSWACALQENAHAYGLEMAFENRPRFNYTHIQDVADASSFQPDTQPRWKGLWSALPSNIGTFFASSKEMLYMMDKAGVRSLPLDIEHLAQTSQWAYVFNDTLGERVRFSDLPLEQRKLLNSQGLQYGDHDILWDITAPTDHELSCRDRFGFTIRKGQPPVYHGTQSLDNQIQTLAKAAHAGQITIPSVTPGFQVYQGYTGSDGQLHIGSHMPSTGGLLSNEQDRWLCSLKNIYAAVKTHLIDPLEIRDIELEPTPTDADGPVYAGGAWDRQMSQCRHESELLLASCTERPDYVHGPPPYL